MNRTSITDRAVPDWDMAIVAGVTAGGERTRAAAARQALRRLARTVETMMAPARGAAGSAGWEIGAARREADPPRLYPGI